MSDTPAARPLLWPLVPLYRVVLALRERKFRPGSPSIRRLRWPVISIGNLSTGGAGKTPLTIALATGLAARGLHVDVLSRGYGRNSVLPLLVDTRGNADDFGDEPLLIAQQTGLPVYVAAQRYRAGLMAEAAKVPSGDEASQRVSGSAGQRVSESAGQRSGVHLLDDGFQHRQLARDVDVLLLNRADMNDHLLPAGNLRESLRAGKRANVIAIPADEPDVEAQLKSIGWQGTLWRLRRRMEIPPVDGPVAAFCGIARPAQFFHGLESVGLHLAARVAFPDHHRYTAADLRRIANEAQKAGATALLTTEKDRVRLGALAESLPPSLPLHAVPLRVEIENEAAAIYWLIDRVHGPR
jgi:tetraacyldisaccharide 4'-kinase